MGKDPKDIQGLIKHTKEIILEIIDDQKKDDSSPPKKTTVDIGLVYASLSYILVSMDPKKSVLENTDDTKIGNIPNVEKVLEKVQDEKQSALKRVQNRRWM